MAGQLKFTVSGRSKTNDVPILTYLARSYGIPFRLIDSVFGFVEKSTLYGGRVFDGAELTPADVANMYEVGIGVRIPFTNHYAEPAEYEATAPVLEKYHRPGNAVIVTNDALARWIRRDFPGYRIEASVIKNLKTYDKIAEALELYDTAVLPMEFCEKEAFLASLPDKDRITLFANAGCALTCPSRICYNSISKFNKTHTGELVCSQTMKQRQARGVVEFDLNRLQALGFSRFKVLTPNKAAAWAVAQGAPTATQMQSRLSQTPGDEEVRDIVWVLRAMQLEGYYPVQRNSELMALARSKAAAIRDLAMRQYVERWIAHIEHAPRTRAD